MEIRERPPDKESELMQSVMGLEESEDLLLISPTEFEDGGFLTDKIEQEFQLVVEEELDVSVVKFFKLFWSDSHFVTNFHDLR